MTTQTQPATYGQTTNYGKFGTGAAGASGEAMAQGAHNDGEESDINHGVNVANDAAKNGTGFQAGAQNFNAANNEASGANGNQAGAIELARRQAMGQGPSAGAMQLQYGLNQASAQQQAMAAGGRGGAALATGQNNAAANVSNLQQTAFGNAGIMRANDMAAGRGMYGTLTSAQRAGDANAISEADRVAGTNAANKDAYGIGMGNAGVALGGVNNANNANDLANFNRGTDPIYAQDEMNQQGKEWLYDDSKDAAAANRDNK